LCGVVRVTTRSGRVFTARRVIVAMAPSLALRIRFEPMLPSYRLQAMEVRFSFLYFFILLY
jgi:hypothetical protein